MDVHVAHRREQQLAAAIVVRQRGVGVAVVIQQGGDFAVLDLQRFQLGAGADDHVAVDVKSGLQQHVVQIVVCRGDVHRFARLAGRFCCVSSIRDGAGSAKQRTGGGSGGDFAALAEKLPAAFILTHCLVLLLSRGGQEARRG